jgi:3-mercaptopyruvate sulfurtransferase SseA
MDYEITPEDVKRKLDAGETFTLLDVREPWEFETARITSAKLMPMGDVPSRAHQELDPDEDIVVLCHHGVRSIHARWHRCVVPNRGSESADVLKNPSLRPEYRRKVIRIFTKHAAVAVWNY